MPARPGPARLGVHHLNTLKDRIELIVKLLRKDFYDPYKGPKLRALAGKIVKACPVRGDVGEKQAGFCELSAIHDFVVKNVRYSGDTTPIGEKPVDLYQSPWRTIEMGIGDCFPEGTLLLRDDFTFVPVEQIRAGDMIWGRDQWTRVEAAVCKGVLPLDAMRLNNGNWLRLTPDHKVFIKECPEHPFEPLTNSCSCAAKDRTAERRVPVAGLREGDVLVSPERIAFGTGEGDPDVHYIEGLYLADGWCSHIYKGTAYDFSIAGQDGCPKEEQKREVEAVCAKLGFETRWHRKYITVKDRNWAHRMHLMGGRAPEKNAPSIDLGEAQAAELLRGIMADSGENSTGGRTFTSTSKLLTLQTRVLHKMFGVSCSWRYIENHGGLGSHPIYRLGVRKPDSKNPKHLFVKEIERNVGESVVYDISTSDHYVYLPECDATVSNCDDISALTVALVTYLGYHAWLRVSSNTGDSWDHIYAVVEFPRVNPYRELVVDPTLGTDKLGIEAPRAKYVDFYR